MLTFNTDGMVRQSFAFPDPIMDYIYKNVQPQHLIKLYPTCKFFYDNYRKNIIRHLEIVLKGECEVFDPVKTIIRASNPVLPKLADFWICDSLTIRVPFFLPPFSPLLQFSHCIIKKLEFTGHVDWKDYEILTKAGTVEELKTLNPILILGTDGITYFPASVDQIIAQVPNAKSIGVTRGYFAVSTCATLNSSIHKAKISNIFLGKMDGMDTFDLGLFTEFIYKNSADNCNIHVDFEPSGFLLIPLPVGFVPFANTSGNDFTERIKAALEMKKNRDF